MEKETNGDYAMAILTDAIDNQQPVKTQVLPLNKPKHYNRRRPPETMANS